MMNPRLSYPEHYRQKERTSLLTAISAGDCVAVIGLSGAGKSNFLRSVMAHISSPALIQMDCNRLRVVASDDFLVHLLTALGQSVSEEALLAQVESALAARLTEAESLCLLFDRFDILQDGESGIVFNHLRVLRDAFKYQLTFVIAMRSPLPVDNELSELFFANTIWLGPLSAEDARWSIESYFKRYGQRISPEEVVKIEQISGRYPAFLRAVCESYRAGVSLELGAMMASPAVKSRLDEFWQDAPDEERLGKAGLLTNPLLQKSQPLQVDETTLTAKEQALWLALSAQPGDVCEKDDLIQSVWPEDVIFERGVRDDSLAQLIRRLREKIEADPSNPEWIITIPGRGYLFKG